MDKLRIDKWLWAARFFKTRSLAKQAIENGRVYCDGQRVKASREIAANTLVKLRRGWEELEIKVIALSNQRRGASEAALLYRETNASLENREKLAIQRKALKSSVITEGRPTKKQRRQIHRFRETIDKNE
ncbi:MAG: ribosome-associated heat shock protein Hsp15 [Cellvibrionaceae bacterium]|jgi:ribosome-associated heat shock protein Hsp15